MDDYLTGWHRYSVPWTPFPSKVGMLWLYKGFSILPIAFLHFLLLFHPKYSQRNFLCLFQRVNTLFILFYRRFGTTKTGAERGWEWQGWSLNLRSTVMSEPSFYIFSEGQTKEFWSHDTSRARSHHQSLGKFYEDLNIVSISSQPKVCPGWL